VGKWEKNGLPHGFKRQAEQHDGIVFALARKEPRTWEEARLEIPAGTAANQFVTGVAKPVGGGRGKNSPRQPETARDAVPWRLQKSEKESGLAVEEANIKDQLWEDTSIIFFQTSCGIFLYLNLPITSATKTQYWKNNRGPKFPYLPPAHPCVIFPGIIM
jgi:hypothetical protein